MATIHKDKGLPPPHRAAVQIAQARRQSTVGRMIRTTVPDQQLLPRIWAVEWFGHAAVVDAVLRHHDENPHATFWVSMPPTGEVASRQDVLVVWAGRPSVSHQTAAAAAASGELIEALAHE